MNIWITHTSFQSSNLGRRGRYRVYSIIKRINLSDNLTKDILNQQKTIESITAT